MNTNMMDPRTIWMRYTNNDGKSHTFEHRVWDKDRFLADQADIAKVEATNAKDGAGHAKAEQITEAEFRAGL